MVLFGADVHPVYQAGLNIEALPDAGISFLSVKVSQGTSSVYLNQGALNFIHRGLAAGMLCMGYHYLTPGNEDAQATVFADALHQAGGITGVSDVEALGTDGKASLNIAGIRAFHTACTAHGARIPFMYLPHWYWVELGAPNLVGLPMLWASSYPSTSPGTPQQLYNKVTPNSWQAYGGLPVGPLQFGDSAILPGCQPVDVNAFFGDRAQFASLLGSAKRLRRHDKMDQLPATNMPPDPNSDPKTWPQRVWDIGFDLAGGWEGEFAFEFGVQEFGGRTVDDIRGFLSLASWRTATGLVPVSPSLAVGGGGQVIHDHAPTVSMTAPHGTVALVLNYAAPGGAYVSEGRSA